MDVIAGADPHDSTTADVPAGAVRRRRSTGTCAACASACRGRSSPRASTRACPARVRRGARDVARPRRRRSSTSRCRTAPHAIAVYYIVATAEASSNLARYDGVRYGFRAPHAATPQRDVRAHARRRVRPEVKRRIMLGTYVLSAGLLRRLLPEGAAGADADPRDYERPSSRVDVIAMPTSPTVAFPLGERTSDPLRCTWPTCSRSSAGLAGLPSISVPCGFSEDLPVGLQLTGRAMDDRTVLRAADSFERVTSWSTTHPPPIPSSAAR